MKNEHLGSSFDDFLMEEGIQEEVTRNALKRVIAWQVTQAMESAKLSKTAMAKKMDTSRSALDRLLDPENSSVTIQTLEKAARAVNKRLVMCLVDEGETVHDACCQCAAV
ncbi:helix-turn-helix domain-containing protein [Maridesulfovibrio frigidus]|uniref:XRE family transcriptional regulator n=1 Tax=Maridesulfovibrio frigidus TaxID=340956 RepID=UPI00068E58D9|nr:XRE family transcriptional regulator [Maridesulfovibrio frigidus]